MENEVLEALWSFKGDKVSSPDGFPMTFWHFYCDFMKEEIMNLFKEFHEKRRFFRS